jgi:hypothetical protein
LLAYEYRILAKKCEGKRPCVRHRHRWEANIKMYTELGYGDFMYVAQQRDHCDDVL